MGMTYHLYLDAPDVLVVRAKADRVEVRGAPNYATDWQPGDPLHEFLDRLDPATVSVIFSYDVAVLNPNNPRAAPSFAACDRLFQEMV